MSKKDHEFINEVLTVILIRPCSLLKLNKAQEELLDFQFSLALNVFTKYGHHMRFKFVPKREQINGKTKTSKSKRNKTRKRSG